MSRRFGVNNIDFFIFYKLSTYFWGIRPLKAANKHIKKKKITPQTKCYLTKEVKESIKERNKLGSTMSSNRREWIEACKKTKGMIVKEKEKCSMEYVETLDRKSDTREIFKTIRAIDGKGEL